MLLPWLSTTFRHQNDANMAMTFGEWMREKRGVEGEPGFVSQNELARRMRVSRSYVVQLEGKDGLPTLPTRQKVHAALGTTEEELKGLGILRSHERTVPSTVAISASDSGTLSAEEHVTITNPDDRHSVTLEVVIQNNRDTQAPPLGVRVQLTGDVELDRVETLADIAAYSAYLPDRFLFALKTLTRSIAERFGQDYIRHLIEDPDREQLIEDAISRRVARKLSWVEERPEVTVEQVPKSAIADVTGIDGKPESNFKRNRRKRAASG
jgi:transcriptional regulator with XRE-family HTH domain